MEYCFMNRMNRAFTYLVAIGLLSGFGHKANSTTIIREAFVWTQETGLVGLGDLPGGEFRSSAHGVSDDGLIIVGQGASVEGREAFRWTQETGMVGLSDLPGGKFESVAQAVTPDGSIIVGDSQSPLGKEAFKWELNDPITGSGTMIGLGMLPGGSNRSVAWAMSGDGEVIVGDGFNASGNNEAFIWKTSIGEMQSLRDVLVTEFGLVTALEGWTLTLADGVSADGTTYTGYGINPAGNIEAWIARATTSSAFFSGLGDLPGGDFFSIAFGISDDGSVVVGESSSREGREAFRWTMESGMIGLGDLPGGAFDSAAIKASVNGSIVVGKGATSPEPGTILGLFLVGGLALIAKVKKQT